MTKQNTGANPPILHFAHANGFPSGSYRQMFCALQDNLRILAIEKFGHSASYPVTKGWIHQVEELMEYIDRQTDEQVYAVGHSFGAVVSYMAVCRYPQRFKGLIMIDPPMVTGITRHMIKLIRAVGATDKFFPSGLAATRNTRWQKHEDLVKYFQGKALFRNMQPACVQDYVDAVIEDRGEHYALGFDHLIEAEIFRTLPLDLHRFYGQLTVPAALVTAEHTNVCKPGRIAPFIRANNIAHEVMPGVGHMIPLEKPVATADMIVRWISEWEHARQPLPGDRRGNSGQR